LRWSAQEYRDKARIDEIINSPKVRWAPHQAQSLRLIVPQIKLANQITEKVIKPNPARSTKNTWKNGKMPLKKVKLSNARRYTRYKKTQYKYWDGLLIEPILVGIMRFESHTDRLGSVKPDEQTGDVQVSDWHPRHQQIVQNTGRILRSNLHDHKGDQERDAQDKPGPQQRQ